MSALNVLKYWRSVGSLHGTCFKSCSLSYFKYRQGRVTLAFTDTGLPNFEARRWYMKKKTIKKPPSKPFAIGMPGEIDPNVEELNLEDPRPGFEDIEELEMCDESVKKIFSLYMADGSELKKKRMENVINGIKEHPSEVATLELQIAGLTVHIRHQVKHMLEYRKDKRCKVILYSRINMRRRKIEQLRQVDFEKFEWLLKELKIKYTPYQERLDKISRAELRRRAAREQFEAVRQAKMEEFSKKLEEERKEFEKVKTKDLEDIQRQLKELGIHEEMKSIDQMLELLGLAGPKEIKSRRRRILAKKFELYKKDNGEQ